MRAAAILALVAALAAAGCGKRGDPVPPGDAAAGADPGAMAPSERSGAGLPRTETETESRGTRSAPAPAE